MLKKTFLLVAAGILIAGTIRAQLPYVKMLDLSKSELKEKKFKYDSERNQYRMSKRNKTNQTMNILNALGGTEADMKPHQEDYDMVIQKGANAKTAYFSVLFYNDDTYHKLATWIAENNIEPIVTSSGKLTIEKFNYDDYAVELITEKVIISSTTGRTNKLAQSTDESYNIYTYSIYTDVKPDSKWHQEEAMKKAKKILKGNKQDLDDLM